MKRRFLAAAASLVMLAAAVAGCGGGTSGGFPDKNKPITWIIPYAPGGGTDNLARMSGKYLNELKILENPMVYENRPGAGGATGMTYFIETHKGNPYVLKPVVTHVITPAIRGDANVNYKDITLIGRYGLDEHLIMVKADGPYKTIKDLIEAAKTRKVSGGGTGTGATDHLVTITLAKAAGVNLAYVPFQSGGEVTTALLGGHIDFIVNNPNESLSQIQSGKFRALAVAAENRLKMLPDVPTLKESGYNVVFQLFRGVSAPPGIPEDARKALEAAFKKLVEHPTFQKEYFEKFGITPAWLGGEDFKKYLDEQDKMYRQLLGELGLAKK